jgi:hypothetical protein
MTYLFLYYLDFLQKVAQKSVSLLCPGCKLHDLE